MDTINRTITAADSEYLGDTNNAGLSLGDTGFTGAAWIISPDERAALFNDGRGIDWPDGGPTPITAKRLD